jgi:hypothetical protein
LAKKFKSVNQYSIEYENIALWHLLGQQQAPCERGVQDINLGAVARDESSG